MTIQFGYNKKQVLDGLRSHFFGRAEIRALFIVINLFAILSAVLFYFKKIQAVSFLVFSLLWFLLWVTVRRILPLSIYKKSSTFRDDFIMSFEESGVVLQTHKGSQKWSWKDFSEFKETMYFFLLYFDGRSFFMVPKDAFKDITEIQQARELLREKIGVRK
ncbi:MAG: YcxB family protein [Bacteroidetes bacterium]|nr:YcxB family protein [Bacteroidota bacterium]